MHKVGSVDRSDPRWGGSFCEPLDRSQLYFGCELSGRLGSAHQVPGPDHYMKARKFFSLLGRLVVGTSPLRISYQILCCNAWWRYTLQGGALYVFAGKQQNDPLDS